MVPGRDWITMFLPLISRLKYYNPGRNKNSLK
jgi:hypothetical protein